MTDHCEEIPASFNEKIKFLLLGETPMKAVDLIIDETYLEVLKDSSWNIVEIISSHLTIENATENIQLFKTCETLLYIIAEKCKPSETILELLEQIDKQENDIKFCTLLKPLKQSFKKLEDKSKAFDWCVNTIKSYIESLPLPDNEIPNEQIQSKSKECRIIDIYQEILFFMKPFVEEASLTNGKTSNIENLILSLLLALLGKPFCYISSNLESSKTISESIINIICDLTGDCLQFLPIVFDRNERSLILIDKTSKSEANLFKSSCQVSDLAYANFYYLIMTEKTMQKKIPQVYNPKYILHSCFYLAYIFLQNKEHILISKGQHFMESVMIRVEKFSLELQTLEFSVHSKLFPCLSQVMIYCDSNEKRKKSLEIFRNYIDLFTIQARYKVIIQLYKTINHSGLLSVISFIVKDSIIMCIEENPPCSYFLGSKLKTLLSIICKLPHGSNTDLIEISEEIIAALNLIRFLTIRDKNNLTGFWDYIEELEGNYLKNLRTGVDMSRAHWKLKVEDLEKERDQSIKNSTGMKFEKHNNISVTVGGENLSMLPVSEKIEISQRALNALDMIENVLTRVNECLEENRQKLYSKD